ncbi:MAG: hypothetical protein IJU62_03245 [Muribaculaceae bacterium]|nr:hypothetical protein [Muribaculaceae bacterium]
MARRRRLKKGPIAVIALLVVAVITMVTRCACKPSSNVQASVSEKNEKRITNSEIRYTPPPAGDDVQHINPESDNVIRFKSRVIPGRLREIFNDTNDLQLTAARAVGFEPISDLRGAYHLKRPIVPIATCRYYALDTMQRMSMPYLVPEAAQLLADIARDFQDTVRARAGADYRLRVTSMTRTDNSVARYRRRYRAATEQSCHRYGTTFDVSWARFDCRDTTRVVNLEDLKNTLAEIIYNKRAQGRCYAIYEHKSGCFHVTVRP